MGEPHELHAILTGPCPCTGCGNAPKCAKGLSCARFSMFVSGEGEYRWRAAPCVPSRAGFEALFGPVDPAERARERLARLKAARERKARARAHPAQRQELRVGG